MMTIVMTSDRNEWMNTKKGFSYSILDWLLVFFYFFSFFHLGRIPIYMNIYRDFISFRIQMGMQNIFKLPNSHRKSI